MSNDQQDFEKLTKLLKLKRYEQPPPGYFNNFSSNVLEGIDSTQHADSIFGQVPWLHRLFTILETSPVAAGLFGMSVCGLLISGIAYSQYHAPAEYSSDAFVPVDMAAASAPDWSHSTASSTTPSINPVFNTNAPSALFGGLDKLSVQQVNYTP